MSQIKSLQLECKRLKLAERKRQLVTNSRSPKNAYGGKENSVGRSQQHQTFTASSVSPIRPLTTAEGLEHSASMNYRNYQHTDFRQVDTADKPPASARTPISTNNLNGGLDMSNVSQRSKKNLKTNSDQRTYGQPAKTS